MIYSNKNKTFKLVIRVIAAITLMCFISYDIVWAYPLDNHNRTSKNTLLQQTLITSDDKAGNLARVAASWITMKVEMRFGKHNIGKVQDVIDYIDAIAKKELEENSERIFVFRSGKAEKGQIIIRIDGTDAVHFYDNEYKKNGLLEDPGDILKCNVSAGNSNPLNDRLSYQFLKLGDLKADEEELANMIASAVRKYYKEKDYRSLITEILSYRFDKGITISEKDAVRERLDNKKHREYFELALGMIHRRKLSKDKKLNIGGMVDSIVPGMRLSSYRIYDNVVKEDEVEEETNEVPPISDVYNVFTEDSQQLPESDLRIVEKTIKHMLPPDLAWIRQVYENKGMNFLTETFEKVLLREKGYNEKDVLAFLKDGKDRFFNLLPENIRITLKQEFKVMVKEVAVFMRETPQENILFVRFITELSEKISDLDKDKTQIESENIDYAAVREALHRLPPDLEWMLGIYEGNWGIYSKILNNLSEENAGTLFARGRKTFFGLLPKDTRRVLEREYEDLVKREISSLGVTDSETDDEKIAWEDVLFVVFLIELNKKSFRNFEEKRKKEEARLTEQYYVDKVPLEEVKKSTWMAEEDVVYALRRFGLAFYQFLPPDVCARMVRDGLTDIAVIRFDDYALAGTIDKIMGIISDIVTARENKIEKAIERGELDREEVDFNKRDAATLFLKDTERVRITKKGLITLSDGFVRHFKGVEDFVVIENPQSNLIEIWPKESLRKRIDPSASVNQKKIISDGSVTSAINSILENSALREDSFTRKEFRDHRMRTETDTFKETMIRDEVNALVALGVLEVDDTKKPYIYTLSDIARRGPPVYFAFLKLMLSELNKIPSKEQLKAIREISEEIDKQFAWEEEGLSGWELIDSATTLEEMSIDKIKALEEEINALYTYEHFGVNPHNILSLKMHRSLVADLVEEASRGAGFNDYKTALERLTAAFHDTGKAYSDENLCLHYSTKLRDEMTEEERRRLRIHDRDSFIVMRNKKITLPLEVVIVNALNHNLRLIRKVKELNKTLYLETVVFSLSDQISALTEPRPYLRDVFIRHKADVGSWLSLLKTLSHKENIDEDTAEALTPAFENYLVGLHDAMDETFEFILSNFEYFKNRRIDFYEFKKSMEEKLQKSITGKTTIIGLESLIGRGMLKYVSSETPGYYELTGKYKKLTSEQAESLGRFFTVTRSRHSRLSSEEMDFFLENHPAPNTPEEAIDLIGKYYKQGVDSKRLTFFKTRDKVGAYLSPQTSHLKMIAKWLSKRARKVLIGYGGNAKSALIFGQYAKKVKCYELNDMLREEGEGCVKEIGGKGGIDVSNIEIADKDSDIFDEDFSEYDLIFIFWPYMSPPEEMDEEELDLKEKLEGKAAGLKPGAILMLQGNIGAIKGLAKIKLPSSVATERIIAYSKKVDKSKIIAQIIDKFLKNLKSLDITFNSSAANLARTIKRSGTVPDDDYLEKIRLGQELRNRVLKRVVSLIEKDTTAKDVLKNNEDLFFTLLYGEMCKREIRDRFKEVSKFITVAENIVKDASLSDKEKIGKLAKSGPDVINPLLFNLTGANDHVAKETVRKIVKKYAKTNMGWSKIRNSLRDTVVVSLDHMGHGNDEAFKFAAEMLGKYGNFYDAENLLLTLFKKKKNKILFAPPDEQRLHNIFKYQKEFDQVWAESWNGFLRSGIYLGHTEEAIYAIFARLGNNAKKYGEDIQKILRDIEKQGERDAAIWTLNILKEALGRIGYRIDTEITKKHFWGGGVETVVKIVPIKKAEESSAGEQKGKKRSDEGFIFIGIPVFLTGLAASLFSGGFMVPIVILSLMFVMYRFFAGTNAGTNLLEALSIADHKKQDGEIEKVDEKTLQDVVKFLEGEKEKIETELEPLMEPFKLLQNGIAAVEYNWGADIEEMTKVDFESIGKEEFLTILKKVMQYIEVLRYFGDLNDYERQMKSYFDEEIQSLIVKGKKRTILDERLSPAYLNKLREEVLNSEGFAEVKEEIEFLKVKEKKDKLAIDKLERQLAFIKDAIQLIEKMRSDEKYKKGERGIFICSEDSTMPFSGQKICIEADTGNVYIKVSVYQQLILIDPSRKSALAKILLVLFAERKFLLDLYLPEIRDRHKTETDKFNNTAYKDKQGKEKQRLLLLGLLEEERALEKYGRCIDSDVKTKLADVGIKMKGFYGWLTGKLQDPNFAKKIVIRHEEIVRTEKDLGGHPEARGQKGIVHTPLLVFGTSFLGSIASLLGMADSMLEITVSGILSFVVASIITVLFMNFFYDSIGGYSRKSLDDTKARMEELSGGDVKDFDAWIRQADMALDTLLRLQESDPEFKNILKGFRKVFDRTVSRFDGLEEESIEWIEVIRERLNIMIEDIKKEEDEKSEPAEKISEKPKIEKIEESEDVELQLGKRERIFVELGPEWKSFYDDIEKTNKTLPSPEKEKKLIKAFRDLLKSTPLDDVKKDRIAAFMAEITRVVHKSYINFRIALLEELPKYSGEKLESHLRNFIVSLGGDIAPELEPYIRNIEEKIEQQRADKGFSYIGVLGFLTVFAASIFTSGSLPEGAVGRFMIPALVLSFLFIICQFFAGGNNAANENNYGRSEPPVSSEQLKREIPYNYMERLYREEPVDNDLFITIFEYHTQLYVKISERIELQKKIRLLKWRIKHERYREEYLQGRIRKHEKRLGELLEEVKEATASAKQDIDEIAGDVKTDRKKEKNQPVARIPAFAKLIKADFDEVVKLVEEAEDLKNYEDSKAYKKVRDILNRIAGEQVALLKKRIARPRRLKKIRLPKRVFDEAKDGKKIWKGWSPFYIFQKYYPKDGRRYAHPGHQGARYFLLWQVYRGYDERIDYELDEEKINIPRIREKISEITEYIDKREKKSREEAKHTFLPGMQDLREQVRLRRKTERRFVNTLKSCIEDLERSPLKVKVLAIIYIKAACELLEIGLAEKAKRVLKHAGELLRERQEAAGSIRNNDSKFVRKELRESTDRRNREFKRLAEDMIKAIENNERWITNRPFITLKKAGRITVSGAAQAIAYSYWVREPEFRKVRQAALGMPEHLNKINHPNKRIARESKDQALAFAHYIKRKCEDAQGLSKLMADYRDRYLDLRSKGKGGSDAKMQAFNSTYEDFEAKANIVRGSPDYYRYFAPFFMAVFLETTKKEPTSKEPITNPLFKAAQDLLLIIDTVDFEYIARKGTLKNETYAVMEGFKDKGNFANLKQSEKRELIKALAADYSLDEKDEKVLKQMARLNKMNYRYLFSAPFLIAGSGAWSMLSSFLFIIGVGALILLIPNIRLIRRIFAAKRYLKEWLEEPDPFKKDDIQRKYRKWNFAINANMFKDRKTKEYIRVNAAIEIIANDICVFPIEKPDGKIRTTTMFANKIFLFKWYYPAVFVFKVTGILSRSVSKTFRLIGNIFKAVFRAFRNSGTKMLLVTVLFLLFPFKVLAAAEVDYTYYSPSGFIETETYLEDWDHDTPDYELDDYLADTVVHREDFDFYGNGTSGRIDRITWPDGSYEEPEYYAGTDIIHFIRGYDAGGDPTFVHETVVQETATPGFAIRKYTNKAGASYHLANGRMYLNTERLEDGTVRTFEYDASWDLTETLIYHTDGRLERIDHVQQIIENLTPGSDFARGANLWIEYGYDIGDGANGEDYVGLATRRELLLQELNRFKGCTVRVFLFCDLRSGIVFDGTGTPTGFSAHVYEDMDTLIEAANVLGIRLMPVLYDYLIADGIDMEGPNPVGEHPDIISEPAKINAILALMAQFVNDYADRPEIVAWDVMSEPEEIPELTSLTMAQVHGFLDLHVQMIHNQDPGSVVTVGARNRETLMDNWTDLGLDLYQPHYYDYMEVWFPIADPLTNWGSSLDGPVIFGELEPTNFGDKYSAIYASGVDGGLFWQDDMGFIISDANADSIRHWAESTDARPFSPEITSVTASNNDRTFELTWDPYTGSLQGSADGYTIMIGSEEFFVPGVSTSSIIINIPSDMYSGNYDLAIRTEMPDGQTDGDYSYYPGTVHVGKAPGEGDHSHHSGGCFMGGQKVNFDAGFLLPIIGFLIAVWILKKKSKPKEQPQDKEKQDEGEDIEILETFTLSKENMVNNDQDSFGELKKFISKFDFEEKESFKTEYEIFFSVKRTPTNREELARHVIYELNKNLRDHVWGNHKDVDFSIKLQAVRRRSDSRPGIRIISEDEGPSKMELYRIFNGGILRNTESEKILSEISIPVELRGIFLLRLSRIAKDYKDVTLLVESWRDGMRFSHGKEETFDSEVRGNKITVTIFEVSKTTPDGFISQGKASKNIFDRERERIRKNDVTDDYNDRILQLLESFLDKEEKMAHEGYRSKRVKRLTEGEISEIKRIRDLLKNKKDEERMLTAFLQGNEIKLPKDKIGRFIEFFRQFKRNRKDSSNLDEFLRENGIKIPDYKREKLAGFLAEQRKEQIKIYGFDSIIVKAENDFMLGNGDHLKDDNELYVATDVISKLKQRGPPENDTHPLVDEYLLHEILCSILGHYRTIVLLQDHFRENYPDRDDQIQDPKKPNTLYKGELQKALRYVLNGPDILLGKYHKPYRLGVDPQEQRVVTSWPRTAIMDSLKAADKSGSMENWLRLVEFSNKRGQNTEPLSLKDVEDRIGYMAEGIEEVVIPRLIENELINNEEAFRVYTSGSYFWLDRSADDLQIDVIADGEREFASYELDRETVKKIFPDLGYDPLKVKINIFGAKQLEHAAAGHDIKGREELLSRLITLPHESILFLGNAIDFNKVWVDKEAHACNILIMDDILKLDIARLKNKPRPTENEKRLLDWCTIRRRGILDYARQGSVLELFKNISSKSYLSDKTVLGGTLFAAFQEKEIPDSASSSKLDNAYINTGLKSGDVFEDRYEIIKEIGSGGMCSVFLVFDREMGRTIALKVMKQGGQRQRERFLREIRYMRELSHKGIIKVHDVYDRKKHNIPFYSMEMIEGPTLGDYIESLKYRKYDEREVVGLFRHIADSIAYMHSLGIIHRDLKPMNVLMRRVAALNTATEYQPLIADLGLAARGYDIKKTGSIRDTMENIFLGTPEYASPEQSVTLAVTEKPMESDESYKRRIIKFLHKHGIPYIDYREEPAEEYKVDIFSLGILLYEMATGEKPFANELTDDFIMLKFDPPKLPKEINSKISLNLQAVIMKCLKLNPRERYSAEELAEDIGNLAEGRETNAYKEEYVQKYRKMLNRRHFMAATLGMIISAAICWFAPDTSAEVFEYIIEYAGIADYVKSNPFIAFVASVAILLPIALLWPISGIKVLIDWFKDRAAKKNVLSKRPAPDEETGGLIGKLFRDKEAADQITEGIIGKEEEEGTILAFYNAVGEPLYTKDGREARVKIIETDLAASGGEKIKILEDNENIRGFANSEKVYLIQSLSENQHALFHEEREQFYSRLSESVKKAKIEGDLDPDSEADDIIDYLKKYHVPESFDMIDEYGDLVKFDIHPHQFLRGAGSSVRLLAHEAKKKLGKHYTAAEFISYLKKNLPPERLNKSEFNLIEYNEIVLGFGGQKLTHGLQDRKSEEGNEAFTRLIKGIEVKGRFVSDKRQFTEIGAVPKVSSIKYAAIIFGALYWAVRSIGDAYLFYKGDILEGLLPLTDIYNLALRAACLIVFVIAGVLGQRVLNKLRSAARDLDEVNRELMASEKQYKEFYDNSPIGFHVLEVTEEDGRKKGIIKQVNRYWCELMGYDEDEIIGKEIFDFMHTDEVEDARRRFEARLRGEDVPQREEGRRYVKKDGTIIYAKTDDTIIKDGKTIVLTSFRDITKLIQAMEEIKKGEEYIGAMLENLPAAVFYKEFDGRKMRVKYANSRFYSMLGLDPETQKVEGLTDIEIRDKFELGKSYDAEKYEADDLRVYQNNTAISVEETNVREGETIHVQVSKERLGNGVLGVFTDITELKQLQKKLEEKSRRLEEETLRDELTDLHNRRYLINEIPGYIRAFERRDEEKGSQNPTPMCAIMCDIDHFKGVNDTYGHPKGDEVLQAIASVVDDELKRGTDFFIRYGGEEFLIIIFDELDKVKKAAEKILNTVRSIEIQGTTVDEEGKEIVRDIDISWSMGIAQLTDKEKESFIRGIREKEEKESSFETEEEKNANSSLLNKMEQEAIDPIVTRADKALYRAKVNGRDRIFISHPDGTFEELIEEEVTDIERSDKDLIMDSIRKAVPRLTNSMFIASSRISPGSIAEGEDLAAKVKSAVYQKKERVGILIDKRLGNGRADEVRKALSDLMRSEDPLLKEWLENIVIHTGDITEMTLDYMKDQKHVKNEDLIVIALDEEFECLKPYTDSVITKINDKDLGMDSYYPLLEIVLFSLARYRLLEFDKEELAEFYRSIPNIDMSRLSADELLALCWDETANRCKTGGIITIKLGIPDAEQITAGTVEYMAIAEYLKTNA